MKAFKPIVLFLLSLFFITIPANGDDSTNDKKPVKTVPDEKNKTIQPRMPSSSNYILCWISPTEIEVEVPEGVEYVDVELSSGNVVVWTTTVTEDENSACLPGLYGEYILTCTTDGNHTFVATVDLR